jgi:hypothetical protein
MNSSALVPSNFGIAEGDRNQADEKKGEEEFRE